MRPRTVFLIMFAIIAASIAIGYLTWEPNLTTNVKLNVNFSVGENLTYQTNGSEYKLLTFTVVNVTKYHEEDCLKVKAIMFTPIDPLFYIEMTDWLRIRDLYPVYSNITYVNLSGESIHIFLDYTSTKIKSKMIIGNNTATKNIRTGGMVHDTLSILYYIRALPENLSQAVRLRIIDTDLKIRVATVNKVGIENVTINGSRLKAVKYILTINGKKTYIWKSCDNSSLILEIVSETDDGCVLTVLTSYEPPR